MPPERLAHTVSLVPVDALPGIGHACGHNLIAVAGCAAAIGVASALRQHKIPGKVVLLGTPAEEGGGGKVKLLDAGAYEGMTACLMCVSLMQTLHKRMAPTRFSL